MEQLETPFEGTASQYLAQLASRGRLSVDQVLELEDHIHSAIEESLGAGYTEEQALHKALSSLGSITGITSEYRKTSTMNSFTRLVGIGIALATIALVAAPLGSPGALVDIPSAILVLGMVLGGLIASFGPMALLRCIRQGLDNSPLPERELGTSLRVARHGYRLCWAAGGLGVIFGIIGVLSNLSDPSQVGPGVAISLFSLLYGALLAELLFSNLVQWLERGGPQLTS